MTPDTNASTETTQNAAAAPATSRIHLLSLTRRVVFEGQLQLRTALHIGAGRSTEVAASDLPVVRDIRGFPYVPGSSLKGVLRSTLEGWIRGLGETRPGMWACDPISPGDCCVPAAAREGIRKECEGRNDSQALYERHILDRSCTTCLLFGSPWVASRVRVSDLPVVNGEQVRVEIRDGVGIDRVSRTAREHMKYDFEIVPPGTAFELSITVDNPADHELGLVVAGLRAFDRGEALLGGKVSRGLGWVKIALEQVRVLTPEGFLSGSSGKIHKAIPSPGDGSQKPGRVDPPGTLEEVLERLRGLVASSGPLDQSALITLLRQNDIGDECLQQVKSTFQRLLDEAVKRKVIVGTSKAYRVPVGNAAGGEAQGAAVPEVEPLDRFEERMLKALADRLEEVRTHV